ncbi:MAG TPA: DUF1570 domain-containing protein [Kofleriaceae bacterium]|nr:DUF1570 domain-containing protein [Kofleriaceae bacterium]
MALASAVAGCAATLPPVPGKGGPAWRELTSEHFTMWTDAEVGRARELVGDMERMRQIIVGVAFPRAPVNGKILVIAFADDAELIRFSRTKEPRAFARAAQAPLWQPMVVLSAFSNLRNQDETLTHELTHAISFSAVKHQPRWLSEGMATYFETLQLDRRRTSIDVGVAPMNRGERRRMPHLVSIATLFGWQGNSDYAVEQRLYGTGWALFTFLVNEHRNELARYLELLDASRGPPKETMVDRGRRVWSEAVPSLPLSAVDEELHQWLMSGHHTVLHFNLQGQQWPITESNVGDADVYALRAMLLAMAGREADARASIQEALSVEPNHVMATLVGALYYKDKLDVTPEIGRTVAAAHPDDWRAWLLAVLALSRAEGESPEEQAAEAKVCELIAKNPGVVSPVTTCGDDPPAVSQ